MIEALVKDLIESIAEMVVASAVTMVDDHQQRRDKIKAYGSVLHTSTTNLLTAVGEGVLEAARKRYLEWLEHPRLGHEPLSKELHAADIGLHDAVVEMKRTPDLSNRILLTGACIRLSAVTEVVGPDCIYLPSIKRAAPVKAARRKKMIPGKNDKRLNRRQPAIGDVPEDVRPIIAGLASDNPDRAGSLAKLEALRGSDHDDDGIITKLSTLAALTEHAAFVDNLAAAAKVAVGIDEEAVPPLAGAERVNVPVVTDTIAATSSAEAAAAPATGHVDGAINAKIAAVADWCRGHPWAVIPRSDGFGVKRLRERVDLNMIFDSVAAHPDMQHALREIYEGPQPAAS